MVAYLAEHPCRDCGESDVGVLEFDHVLGKTHDVAFLIGHGAAPDRIHAEIEPV